MLEFPSTELCAQSSYLLWCHGKTTFNTAQRLLDIDKLECDGRPAECTWRPLFNAAKFGWRPLLECRAVMLPRRESHWNLQGCPKLANRSQPLVGRSSPYYEDMWTKYRCLTGFFRLSTYASAAKIQPDKVARWCQNGDLLRPVFSASHVQHISDMHSKFALGPHHV